MTDAGPQAAAREPWTIYGEPVRGRSCGSCTLCCTLLPVELPSGPKPANARCPHSYSKGCRIYARRPDPCRYWSCRWLFDPATAGLKRPDQSGVVIDAALDTILADGRPLDVLQIWCDPNRRDAHRDPAVRAYLADVARRTGMVFHRALGQRGRRHPRAARPERQRRVAGVASGAHVLGSRRCGAG